MAKKKQKTEISTEVLTDIPTVEEIVTKTTAEVEKVMNTDHKYDILIVDPMDEEIRTEIGNTLSKFDIAFIPEEIGKAYLEGQKQEAIKDISENKILSMLNDEENKSKMKELAMQLADVFGNNTKFAISRIYKEIRMSNKTNVISLLEMFGYLVRDTANPDHFCSISIDGKAMIKSCLDNIMTEKRNMQFYMQKIRDYGDKELQGVAKEILQHNGLLFQTTEEILLEQETKKAEADKKSSESL